MNYLITGATGFIGRPLVKRLLDEGNTVNYFARKRSPQMDSRAAFFCWKPGDEPALDCVPTLDAIIHLAGEPVAQRWNDETRKRIRESRVDGTRALVDAIAKLKRKPSVLVSASAIGYYGDRGSELLTENSAPANDFLAQLCVRWEEEAVRAREFGLRVVPVRLAVVLGADGGALKPMLPMFRAGLGARIGSGAQWMSWIHVEDVVSLLRFAAVNDGVTEAMNASSPQPVQNREFTRLLAHTLHRPALLSIPVFALRVLLGEVAGHVAASSRVLPERTLGYGFAFAYPHLQDALHSILSHGSRPGVPAASIG